MSAAPSSLRRLEQLLKQSAVANKTLTDDIIKVETVALHGPDDTLRMGTGEVQSMGGLVVLEAVLHPIVDQFGRVDELERRRVLTKFRELVDGLGGRARLDRRRNENGLTFVPVLAPGDQLNELASFNPLRTLRPMPRFAPQPIVLTNPFRGAITPDRVLAPSAGPRTDQRIAVFDGGVDLTAPALTPYTTCTDLTGGVPEASHTFEHGTMVTSAALYGSLESTEPTEVPPAGVDMFRVWPPPASEGADTNLYWVLARIEEQVRKGNHRIVNLSLGPLLNVEDDQEPHLWTLTLDRLAAEFGVLFVVAAGNTGQEDAAAGLNRIGVPADVINGLSVGACDARAPLQVRRAPYSSVGPGRPGGRVAPTGVAHGGTEDAERPFWVVAPGGNRGYSHGTSLAAPAVARSMADLSALVDSAPGRPHLMRAFACHFAERCEGREGEVGWGRLPERYEPLMGCNPNEAIVLYDGNLRRGQSLKLPVPLPTDLLRTLGGRLVNLRYTLVFTTPVDGTDAVDYGRSGIEIVFRPHAQNFTMNRDGSPSKTVNRETDEAGFDQLIREGYSPSDRPKTRSKGQFAPETERRLDGKWETAARADDSLQARSLLDPAFDLHYLARDTGQLTDAHEDLSLPYALLVTASAPVGVPLYDRVRAHAPLLTPITSAAQVTVRA